MAQQLSQSQQLLLHMHETGALHDLVGIVRLARMGRDRWGGVGPAEQAYPVMAGVGHPSCRLSSAGFTSICSQGKCMAGAQGS
jgi:hypothetical protein